MVKRGMVGLCAAAASVLAMAADPIQAQFVGTRFNGQGGSSIFDGQVAVHNNPVFASGLYNQANWQDNGAGGLPDDFNAGNGFPNFDIPADTIGVDEDEWALVGSGVLTVQTSGNYTFRTATDDSSRIVLAGRNVVVAAGGLTNVDGDNAVPLVAGQRYAIQTIVKEGFGDGYGEFSVSRDGLGFQLLGTGTSSDFTVTPAIGNPVGFTPAAPGLTVKVYSTPGAPNQNRDIDTFLAGNPAPLTTLTVSSTNTGALPTDVLVTSSGLIRIDAGDDLAPGAAGIQVKFVIDSDDNSRLSIAGLTVMENDGGHGPGHLVSDNQDLLSAGTGDNAGGTQVLTFPAAGFYELSAFTHNGGGGGFGVVLSSIGGTNGSMVEVPGSRLFLVPVPEPGSLPLIGLAVAGLLVRCRR